MLIRFTVITSSTTLQRHGMPKDPSEKNMVKPKSVPITKITNVHVGAEDPSDQIEFRSMREKQSATIALSLELAKQVPRGLYCGWTATAVTVATESVLFKGAAGDEKVLRWVLLGPPHHVLPVQQQQYNPTIQGSSNKKRQRSIMSSSSSSRSSNNPTKAIAETTLTRVSAGGHVSIQLPPDIETNSAVAVLEEQHRQASVFEMTYNSPRTQCMTRSGDLISPQQELNIQKEPRLSPPREFSIKTSSERRSISVNGNPVLPAFEELHPRSITVSRPLDHQIKPPTSWLNYLSNFFVPKLECDEPRIMHLHASLSSMIADLRTNKSMRKIVIVGVHGWFPMKLVRSMIGEPTGTSKKFCDQMAIALRQYFLLEHQFAMPEEAITVIPLEGEGKIEERVNKLYNQLLGNVTWLEAILTADAILWSSHSQGMPVSVMLLHRLLEENHIRSQHTAVCLLSMAGIGHGPFPALQGNLFVKYFEASAARELFEFMDSTNSISQRFRTSLAYILENDIKLTLVGSLQDQVVPLHSGILNSISHPNIMRAVYIDKHIYNEDDFLINLVVFAIRLRNAGLSDHDLLIHVSQVLAGSIYAIGGGHSTIYEELDVYLMAIRHLFDYHRLQSHIPAETYPSHPIISGPNMRPFRANPQPNPFNLPWAVRGIFDDKAILEESWSAAELKRLLQLFRQWTPTSTRLREVKFRLEPLAEHTL